MPEGIINGVDALENGFYLTHFTCAENISLQPGDRVALNDTEHAALWQHHHEWQLLSRDKIIKKKYLAEIINKHSLSTTNKNTLIAEGDAYSITDALFAGRLLKKENRQPDLVVLITDDDLPFKPAPSQFMITHWPGWASAAAPLLESTGIASRVVSDRDWPGCLSKQMWADIKENF